MPTPQQAAHALLRIYDHVDQFPQPESTCTRGCAACCSQMVLITPLEGRQLADVVLEMPEPQRKATLARLMEEASASNYKGMTLQGFFEKGRRCAFLAKNNDCLAYAMRPLGCRMHFAITDPKHCSGPTQDQAITPFSPDLQSRLQALVSYLHEEGQLPRFAAPIPNMVLTFLRSYAEQLGDKTILAATTGPYLRAELWYDKYRAMIVATDFNAAPKPKA